MHPFSSAGDAIIVIFPADGEAASVLQQTRSYGSIDDYEESDKDYSYPAITCALALKDIVYNTLTVHVAISVGEICFAVLGGYRRHWENLISGPCIFEISQCLDDAPSGHCVITSAVKSKLKATHLGVLNLLELESGNFQVNVKEGLQLKDEKIPESCKSSFNFSSSMEQAAAIAVAAVTTASTADSASSLEQHQTSTGKLDLPMLPPLISIPRNNHNDDCIQIAYDYQSVKSFSTPVSAKRNDREVALLNQFVPKPVVTYLQSDVLNYLAELRVVTTFFMKWDSFDSVLHRDLTSLQEAFLSAQTIVIDAGGFIRQFLVDDKGCVLIACWGVPTSVHLDNAERALNAAVAVRDSLARLRLKTSFGITTGSVYCGCVGSNQRQEYAAIGDVVNMAARLMSKAKGGIYIDERTKMNLMPMALESLVELPPMTVKGKSEPIKVYEYSFSDMFSDLDDSVVDVGMVNEEVLQERYVRPMCKEFFKKQIQFVKQLHNGPSSSSSDSMYLPQSGEAVTLSRRKSVTEKFVSDIVGKIFTPDEVESFGTNSSTSKIAFKANNETYNQSPVKYALVEGHSGSGKASMMKWLKTYASGRFIRVVNVKLTGHNVKVGFSAVASLFRQLVGAEVFDDLELQKGAMLALLKAVYGSDTSRAIQIGLWVMKLVLDVDPQINVDEEELCGADGSTKSTPINHINAMKDSLKIETIITFFHVLLRTKPTILIIESVHYADESSLEVIEGLDSLSCSVLIVLTSSYPEDITLRADGEEIYDFDDADTMTFQEEEPSEGVEEVTFRRLQWLSIYRSIILRKKSATSIDLLPYDVPDIESIIQEFYPQITESHCYKLSQMCHEISGGNLFWLIELISYIANSGTAQFVKMASSLEKVSIVQEKQPLHAPPPLLPGASIAKLKKTHSRTGRSFSLAGTSSYNGSGFSGGISDQHMNFLEVFVICRFERLAADEQMCLRTIAVIGFKFSVAACKAVLSDRMIWKLPDMLKKLMQLNWIVLVKNGATNGVDDASVALTTEYRFGHPLFHRVLYNVTPPSERLYVHQAVAEHLISLPRSALSALSISNHFSFCDENRAIEYKIQSASLMLNDRSRGVVSCLDLISTNFFIRRLDRMDQLEKVMLILSSAESIVQNQLEYLNKQPVSLVSKIASAMGFSSKKKSAASRSSEKVIPRSEKVTSKTAPSPPSGSSVKSLRSLKFSARSSCMSNNAVAPETDSPCTNDTNDTKDFENSISRRDEKSGFSSAEGEKSEESYNSFYNAENAEDLLEKIKGLENAVNARIVEIQPREDEQLHGQQSAKMFFSVLKRSISGRQMAMMHRTRSGSMSTVLKRTNSGSVSVTSASKRAVTPGISMSKENIIRSPATTTID